MFVIKMVNVIFLTSKPYTVILQNTFTFISTTILNICKYFFDVSMRLFIHLYYIVPKMRGFVV